MKLVVIESPYAGHRRKHDAYLKAALLDSFSRGEAPYASHAVGPMVLNDAIPEQRAQGIAAGLAWSRKASVVAAYVDLGISRGMTEAIALAEQEGRPVEFRRVPGWKWP